MSGTEWTKPGTGATLGELAAAVNNHGDGNEAAERLTALAYREGDKPDWNIKSNLNLNGPLTAYDIKRIASIYSAKEIKRIAGAK